MTRRKDILDELTKEELVSWVRNQMYCLPKRSEILYMRWSKQSADLVRDNEGHTKSLDGINLAERDRLARLFNESNDPEEKLRLLEQMEPYGMALTAHVARYKVLDSRQKKVDKLYEQIDIERQKERAR